MVHAASKVRTYRQLANHSASRITLHRIFDNHPISVDSDQRETVISLNISTLTHVHNTVAESPAFIPIGNMN